jgi:predicted methyltransferase
MRNSLLPAGVITAAVLCLAVPVAAADAEVVSVLNRIITGEHRVPGNIARNQYRHPVETLTFFGMRPDMTVVEISPGGGGWYTEVLAPFLREKGRLTAANYDSSSEIEYYRRNAAKYLDKLKARPDVYDRVTVIEFAPPKKPDLGPEGSADMVVTFRNVHNWIENGTESQVFAAVFKVLKKGGVLGLVEHRGNPEMVGKQWAEKGYVAETEVIRLAEQAGFKLADRSEINANPKDTKDYPKGVWTLPPTLEEGDKDRDRYLAIGESDRMTLKFIKP